MPRIKLGFSDAPRKADRKLVDRLVDELKAGRESGQPFIYETAFPNGRVRVLVVWDDWSDLPLDQRTAIITSAIEQADGREYRAKVALASGLTVPEGVAGGVLPYQIITARRNGDAVTAEQCREAMLAEGASQLFGPGVLALRFPVEESAEECRKRLARRLPGSEDVWIVSREIASHDFEHAAESTAAGAG